MHTQAASVRAEVHSPVGAPFVLDSRRNPHYCLPLHASPRRTSNLSFTLEHPPYSVLPHNTRTHPALFLPSISTHPRLLLHGMHTFPLFIVVISVRCMVVRPSRRRWAYAPHTMSGPHYSQRLIFDKPVLDFEAYPKWISITSPALDFCFAGAVEVGLVFGLVEKHVAGLAFGCRQWIDVSDEQQQRILPTRSILVLTFVSSNVIEAVSSTLSLLASSSTSGSASILVL